jgi:hypothetical protein
VCPSLAIPLTIFRMSVEYKSGKIKLIWIHAQDIPATAAGEKYFHLKQITNIEKLVMVTEFIFQLYDEWILSINFYEALRKKFLNEPGDHGIIVKFNHAAV